MNIINAIKDRQSIRAFDDRLVENDVIRSILDTARFSPSGANCQPWRVAVVTGDTREALSDALLQAHRQGEAASPDYQYYPREWVEPYRSRRFKCGMDLYTALDIKRDDTQRRIEAWEDNYRFFGAPAVLFFFIHRQLAKGSWLDLGMFIQSVMLAAREYELGSVPQASLAEYPAIVRRHLDIADEYALACGLSLGYPDMQNPVNRYRTERELVDNFTNWYT